MDAHDWWLIAAWTTLHGCGVLAAWASRLRLARWAERANHLLLTAAFLAIAGLAVLHLSTGYQLSLLSATTLGLMAVGAVCECRADAEDQTLSRVMAAYEPTAAR